MRRSRVAAVVCAVVLVGLLASVVPKLRSFIDDQDTNIAAIQSASARGDLSTKVSRLADEVRSFSDCVNTYMQAVAEAGGSYDYSLC